MKMMTIVLSTFDFRIPENEKALEKALHKVITSIKGTLFLRFHKVEPMFRTISLQLCQLLNIFPWFSMITFTTIYLPNLGQLLTIPPQLGHPISLNFHKVIKSYQHYSGGIYRYLLNSFQNQNGGNLEEAAKKVREFLNPLSRFQRPRVSRH